MKEFIAARISLLNETSNEHGKLMICSAEISDILQLPSI